MVYFFIFLDILIYSVRFFLCNSACVVYFYFQMIAFSKVHLLTLTVVCFVICLLCFSTPRPLRKRLLMRTDSLSSSFPQRIEEAWPVPSKPPASPQEAKLPASSWPPRRPARARPLLEEWRSLTATGDAPTSPGLQLRYQSGDFSSHWSRGIYSLTALFCLPKKKT